MTLAASDTVPVKLGQSVIRLYAPWRFNTGDDLRWADPHFDDAHWRSMDLTPAPGATDGDVGLEGFASGWNAKGYPGYHGFAWYRMRVNVMPAQGQTIALLGPWAVDSAYQFYINGRLLGGVGDFTGSTPRAFGYHYPRFFALPASATRGGPLTIAIRVWAGPWIGSPESGGIHIAPVIGNADAILALYRLEELKIFEGYAVDVVPATLFVLAAVLALGLLPMRRNKAAYAWLAAALLLSAIQRGNQPFFFWFEIETVQVVVIVIAIVGTLAIASWIMAWRAWLDAARPAWLPWLVAVCSVVLVAAQILSQPWLFTNPMPAWIAPFSHTIATWTRLAFIATLVWIVFEGFRRNWREAFFALPAILVMSAFVFSSELARIHVTGIWFPWGVGVSLSECASVVACVFLAVLLLNGRPKGPICK